MFDIVRVSPRSVRFEELPPALLALVTLPAAAVPVLNCLSGIALRTFHPPILANLTLAFQQRQYEKFSAIEGIQLLRQCDAVPVWAHPYLFRGGEVAEVLPELVAAGLMGIEVYHPSHTASQRAQLETVCQRYGLLMTGGSDYHGPSQDANNSRHTDLNQLQLSDALLLPLQQAAQRLRADRNYDSQNYLAETGWIP